MERADVVIAGSGITGMALALELRRRGRDVLLLCRNTRGTASTAAAGMLAAHDPHNPPDLQPLAGLALQLYPDFLGNIRNLSGQPVPIHTHHVLEPDPTGTPGRMLLPALSPSSGNFRLRAEQSLDPRELTAALARAITIAGVREQSVLDAEPRHFTKALSLQAAKRSSFRPDSEVPARTDRSNLHFASEELAAAAFVDCTGAWSSHTRPAKGQMLRVQLPANTLRLPDGSNVVLRTEDIYLVPRLDGTTLIGATVEDAGFDLTLHPTDLDDLREKAAVLIPAAATAPQIEAWSGLRPRTADDLPILGELAPNHFVANGLFRNGILLAPAVARVMAQRLCGEQTDVDLTPFSPHRLVLHPQR